MANGVPSDTTEQAFRDRLLQVGEVVNQQQGGAAQETTAAQISSPPLTPPSDTTEQGFLDTIQSGVETALEKTGIGPAFERIGEQTLWQSQRIPGVFATREQVSDYIREGELIQTADVTLGEAARTGAKFFTEDIASLWDFGKLTVLESADFARVLAEDPELVANSFNVTDPDTRRQALRELAAEIDRPLEEVRNAQRGMALAGGALMLGPAGHFARQGITRAVGSVLGSGRVAQALAGEGGSALADWAIKSGIRTGTGAARGGAFGATYGLLRPLGEDEQSNLDAALHDGLVFSAIDSGLGLLTTTGSAIGRNIQPGRDEQRQMIRDQFEFMKETLSQPNGPSNPMPAEPLSAEEAASQVAAGATTQGATKLGFWKTLREAPSAVSDMITKRFGAARKIDPALWSTSLSALDSQIGGMYFGRRAKELLTMGMSSEKENILGKAVVESRLRQVSRDQAQLADKLDRATAMLGRMEGSNNERLADALERLGIQRNDAGEAVTRINGTEFTADDLRGLSSRVRTEILTPEERRLLDNDPDLQRALDDLQNVINPVAKQLKMRNGMHSTVEPDLPFVRLVPARQRHIDAEDMQVVRGRTDIDDATAAEQARTGRQIERGGGGRFGTRTEEVGQQAAMGQAPAYVADLEQMFRRDFGTTLRADFKNEAIGLVADAPWSTKLKAKPTKAGDSRLVVAETGEPAPAEITLDNGRTYEAVARTFHGNPQVINKRRPIHQNRPDADEVNEVAKNAEIRARPAEGQPAVGAGEQAEVELGTYAIPKPIDDMLRETFGNKNRSLAVGDFDENAFFDAYSGFMDLNVRLLLSSPIEATAHMNRILSQFVRTPGLGDDQGALAKLANRFGAWFGPRLTGLNEIMNVYKNPEAIKMEAFLATKVPGALPTRAFPYEFATRGVGDEPASRFAGELGKAAEEAEEVLEVGRRLLFNLPEMGRKGVWGFDTRTRVSAALALRRITRNELGRDPTVREYSEFLQDFGQYTDEIQSDLVQFFRKSRLAPFAGTQAGFIPGEIKRFFGNPGLPKSIRDEMSAATMGRIRAETLWRGTFGTALATALTQRALTEDWPWENEPGHKSDLKIGHIAAGEGAEFGPGDIGSLPASDLARPVYIPTARLIDPVLGRAHRILGARSAIENFDDTEDIIPDALLDLANQAIMFGTGAPGIGAATTLTTGSATFVPEEGQLLRTVPPQPNATLQMKHRFMEAAGTANPTFEAIFGTGKQENVPAGIRFVNAVTPGMEVGRPVQIGETAAIREEQSEMQEVAADRVLQALQKHPRNLAERKAFYFSESEKFTDRLEAEAAYREMLQLDAAFRRGTAADLQRARSGEPFP